MGIKQADWKGVAVLANNLSELELTLGDAGGAVEYAKQSVTYADRSGDSFLRMAVRTGHADTLHQVGRRAEAETRFREAEQMQKEWQPTYPLLYSVQGFHYCDLLLAAPERAAWQMMLKLTTQTLALEILIESSRSVSLRAAQTLKIVEPENWLLDIGLDHLTLGRAALYEVALAAGGLPFKTQNSELKTSIDVAVEGLRCAGEQWFLPPGLLTRAWLRFLIGGRTGPSSAQEDLDEAWEIAERGPMKLFMADIHLYRARLFGGMKDEGGRMKYPWDKNPDGSPRGPKDDLAAAERLISECGYHRRDAELADAKDVAEDW
jgi:hypothetical protein